ncbi:hypothetical protein [Endozoicomonas atrinae]|uniref:hypothetical protein n=1 Tax=Endozoicomonas atrinae TaxID=1333660 RepID=UPI001112EF6C|nr:hypothetical protein [Endozoicomonas atrinae]
MSQFDLFENSKTVPRLSASAYRKQQETAFTDVGSNERATDFKSFELVFETGSPVTLRKHPIHLDGLLSYACFQHTGCPEKALAMLHTLLKYDEHHDLYHGSALAFGVTPEQGITARHRHYVGSLRFGKQLRDNRITPSRVANDGTEVFRRVFTTGGPEKSRLNRFEAFHSPWLVFHGVGDIHRIESLAQFYCARIGVNANSGSGTVRNLWINTIDHDYSMIDAHGQIARNLPMTWLQNQEQAPDYTRSASIPVKAPYWPGHQQYRPVDGVPADKVRRVILIR